MKSIIYYLLFIVILCSAAFGNVTETESKESPQACNGSTTAFTFDFPLANTSELIVRLRTVATGDSEKLEETTDYVVSATNNDYTSPGGGTCTTEATYSSAYTISLSRSTPQTQGSSLLESDGTLRLSAFRDALDKLTRIVQELQEEIARAPRVPIDDSSITTTLVNSIDRGGKVLGFDSEGNYAALDSIPEGSISVSAYMETVNAAANASAAKTLLEVPTITAAAETVLDDATVGAMLTTLGGIANTGNENIAGEKTFDDAATFSTASTFADESVMASTAAPTTDAMVVNKKYSDDAHEPYARMFITAAQDNLTDDTWTTITLDTDTFDFSTITDLANYKITPGVAGYYMCVGQVTYESVIADKSYAAQLYFNGTTAKATSTYHGGAATEDMSCPVIDVILFDSNDYIQLRGKATCGAGTVDINTGTADTYLILFRL